MGRGNRTRAQFLSHLLHYEQSNLDRNNPRAKLFYNGRSVGPILRGRPVEHVFQKLSGGTSPAAAARRHATRRSPVSTIVLTIFRQRRARAGWLWRRKHWRICRGKWITKNCRATDKLISRFSSTICKRRFGRRKIFIHSSKTRAPTAPTLNDSVYLLLVQSTLPKETNIANCLTRMAAIAAHCGRGGENAVKSAQADFGNGHPAKPRRNQFLREGHF